MSASPRPGRPEAAATVWPWKEAGRRAAREAARARRGGLVRGAVAAALGAGFFLLGARHVAVVAWCLGGVVAALALLSPAGAYRRLDVLGKALGRAAGTLLGHLLLSPVYYLALAPFGLLRRRGRRDLLGRAPDARASTYFVRREKDGPARLEKPY